MRAIALRHYPQKRQNRSGDLRLGTNPYEGIKTVWVRKAPYKMLQRDGIFMPKPRAAELQR